MTRNVTKTWKAFRRSKKYLGHGSSTSSKAALYEDMEPAVIDKAKGCRVWDLDGNEYIDYRNSLGPITLGYGIDEVNQAIREQLDKGIIFGHPHVLEGMVAEKLTQVIPCAEKVRFLKTGGEAIAACIKIARSATGRNHIVQCGYNGWLNTLSNGPGFKPAGIASSQPLKGIPAELSALHSTLPWGQIEVWEQEFKTHGQNIAAVVIACNYSNMEIGHDFLPKLRELTSRHGTLLILDEIVTGFRLAIGGAQEYFDFMPDMAVFAKGMANGMPISAYLGRSDLIDSASQIGISSTFGGETLSLAAANSIIDYYQKNSVIDHLWKMGTLLVDGVNDLFKKHNIKGKLSGFAVCPALQFENIDTKNSFFQGCYRNGVSLYNVLYVNYSHKQADIDETIQRIDRVIANDLK